MQVFSKQLFSYYRDEQGLPRTQRSRDGKPLIRDGYVQECNLSVLASLPPPPPLISPPHPSLSPPPYLSPPPLSSPVTTSLVLQLLIMSLTPPPGLLQVLWE